MMAWDYRLLLNLLLSVEMSVYIAATITRKRGFLLTTGLIYVLNFVGYFLASNVPYMLVEFRQLIGIGVLFLGTMFLSRDRWPKVLVICALSLFAQVASELGLVALNPAVVESPNFLNEITAIKRTQIICTNLVINGVLLLFANRLFRRKNARLSGMEWGLFILFPVSQLFLLTLFEISLMHKGETPILLMEIIAIITCVAADVGIYFAVRGLSQRAALKAQNAQLARQVEAQKRHYADLTGQYEQIRRLRHDIANHVHTIRVLLDKGEAGEAGAYADDILQRHSFHATLGACENPVVDAFLYGCSERAAAQQTQIDFALRLPAELRIQNADLITVLGNLLDNAMEACGKLPAAERRIRLQAATEGDYLVLRTENPLPAHDGGSRERHPALPRGMGMLILGDVAAQYGGALHTTTEDGRFIATITLRMEEETAA